MLISGAGLVYGSETWTLGKRGKKYVESFEVTCWRKIEEGKKWTEMVKMMKVLRRVNDKSSILTAVFKRKANWVGHVLKRRNFLLYNVIGEYFDGVPGYRGRRRRVYMVDYLKEKRFRYWVMKEE